MHYTKPAERRSKEYRLPQSPHSVLDPPHLTGQRGWLLQPCKHLYHPHTCTTHQTKYRHSQSKTPPYRSTKCLRVAQEKEEAAVHYTKPAERRSKEYRLPQSPHSVLDPPHLTGQRGWLLQPCKHLYHPHTCTTHQTKYRRSQSKTPTYRSTRDQKEKSFCYTYTCDFFPENCVFKRLYLKISNCEILPHNIW